MALLKCKECDKEVSDKAKVCPNCGSPVSKSMGWVAKVLIGLVVIGILGNFLPGGSGFKDLNSSPGSIQSSPRSQEAALSVSAIELVKAYADNEAAADAVYKDKLLSITGTITSITKNITDDTVLELRGTNDYMGVQASLEKSEEKRAIALKKGQKITIQCRGEGEVIGSPMLGSCVIP